MSIETPASNGIIKSLTNGGGFGTSAERRCNFISTAEFHSSSTPYNESQLFPALCISAGGRAHVRTATLARQRRPPTEFHFCKLFFHFVPRARSSVLSPRVSGIEPREHNKSFLSSSRGLRVPLSPVNNAPFIFDNN